MANVYVDESSLQDIADSIRAKNSTQNTYKPGQMAAAIDALPSGGITPTGTLEVTANGTYDVTNYASAEVSVPTVSAPVINPLSVTANGTYTAPSGVDGYSPVTVNVPSSAPTGTKQISITANGTITEDVSAYENAEITVNVSSGGGGLVDLIDTIVIDSDTRTYDLDLTPYASYDLIIVAFDTVTLSASDYIYMVRNGTAPSGGSYTASKTTFSGVAAIWGKLVSPNKRLSILPTSTTANVSDASLTNIFMYCYSESKTFKAGSTIKIYGG